MTNNTGEQIVALQVQMNDIQGNISEIKSDIKSILANLAVSNTQDAIINKELKDLKDELDDIRRKQNFWKWLSPTLAAVAGSILTFLIIQYFMSFK